MTPRSERVRAGVWSRIGREACVHALLFVGSWHAVFALLAIGALKGADGGPADLWSLYRLYAPAMWSAPTGEMVGLIKYSALWLFGMVAAVRWLLRRHRARLGSAAGASQ